MDIFSDSHRLRVQMLTQLLHRWAFCSQQSTRSSALIRIFLPCVIWCRWGRDFLLFREHHLGWMLFSASFFIATFLLFIGLWSRLAAIATSLMVGTIVYYFGYHEGNQAWTHHHTVALALLSFWFSFAPCGRSLAVDRWLEIRRAQKKHVDPPPEIGNVFALRLVALQLSAIYFWTAIDKLNPAFLAGVKMEEYFLWYYWPEIPETWLWRPVMLIVSWGTVLLEFALAFGLLFGKTRRWLIVPGVVLHGLFYVLLPVQTYSVTIWVFYVAYLEANTVHRVMDCLLQVKPLSHVSAASCSQDGRIKSLT